MRVMVTGGAGFIGSHVVDKLLVNGFDVRVFDIVYPQHHDTSQVEFHHGSLLDTMSLGGAMSGVDVVYHLAAVADVNTVYKRPHYAESINTRGTINVLEAARNSNVKRVLFGSTTWVYSNAELPPGEQAFETTSLGPPDHLYTATKIAGENYCRAYAELYDLSVTVMRYGIPYGPRARPEGVLPIFVRRALAGEGISINGDGKQFRKFIYVEDLAEGNVAAMKSPDKFAIYNLDGRQKVTIREMAETVCDAVGSVPVTFGEPRPGDFDGIDVNSDLAETELGWLPDTSFGEGVRRYVDWYQADTVTRSEDLQAHLGEFSALFTD